jgi:DNA-binding transcriptional MerR regulator
MDKLISVDNLIKKAEQQKINFGKGDPYNRLRYYTKIGWLPHMVRKKEDSGEVKGHYPESALDTLVFIENLKLAGLTNEQIQKKLDEKNTSNTLKTTINSKSFRKKMLIGAVILSIIGIISGELGLFRTGILKSGNFPVGQATAIAVNGVLSSGDAFMPKGQNKIFIPVKEILKSNRVLVTFSQDYFPATRYWVSEIKQGNGFILEMDTTPQNDSGFTWWVIK